MNDLIEYTGITWGYARVSTEEQSLDLQIDAVVAAGIPRERIVTEKHTGRKMARPEFDRLKLKMARGDCLAVWKLDRLGRSTIGVLKEIEQLEKDGIHFRCINDVTFDTTSPMGKFILTLISAIAQLESDFASQRTKAGLAAARKRGNMPGRKHLILKYPKRIKRFTELWIEGLIPDGIMSAQDVIDEMNKADPKAPKIKNKTSYSNWKAAGFPGFERPKEND